MKYKFFASFFVLFTALSLWLASIMYSDIIMKIWAFMLCVLGYVMLEDVKLEETQERVEELEKRMEKRKK